MANKYAPLAPLERITMPVPPTTPMSPVQDRRAVIRQLLEDNQVQSQQELLELLAQRGFATTQPVLSRDLRKLKVAKREGTYQLVDEGERVTPLENLQQLLRSAHPAGPYLLVVATEPGAANAIARAIEAEAPAGLVGTIAGDDTVLVAVAILRPPPRASRPSSFPWRACRTLPPSGSEAEKQRVLLAYSGGLDTSYLVAWLTREQGAEVTTLAVDCGGWSRGRAHARFEERSQAPGARSDHKVTHDEATSELYDAHACAGSIAANVRRGEVVPAFRRAPNVGCRPRCSLDVRPRG